MKKQVFKQIIATSILTIFLLSLFTIPVFAKTGKVNDSNIRVRSGPSKTGTETIENLYLGDYVEILGREGDWYKVKTESGKVRIYVL